MRHFFRNNACLFLIAICFASVPPRVARAADATWNFNAAGNWSDAGSWTPGAAPGSTTTDNADTATFTFALTGNRIITVDANRYIGNITFGNTANFGFTLQAGALHLNSGGVIQTTGTGVRTDTISATNVISGVSGSTYTFTAGSSGTLTISGAITGSAMTGNTTTLTLNGSSTSGNLLGAGVIGNGAGGGKLTLAKDGAGLWRLSGANTFSGGLYIKAGTVALTTATAAGNAAGTICIGDSTGNSSATLSINNTVHIANRISVVKDNTGMATINFTPGGNTGYVDGSITLNNHDLFVTATANNSQITGGITGIGNLTFAQTGTGLVNVNTSDISITGNITFNNSSSTGTQIGVAVANTVNNTGSINNISSGSGAITISGTIGSSVTGIYQNSSSSALIISGGNNSAVPITITTGQVQLGGTQTLSGLISGTGSLAISGTVVTLSGGANTYTGITTLSGGILSLDTLGNAGTVSNLGSTSNAAGNLVFNGGTLKFTGSTNTSTDRNFTIGSGNAVIDASGSGTATLTWNGTPSYDVANAARTLTLTGTNTSSNTFAANIGDNGTAAVSLTKSGAGTWVLTGSNSYTGLTTFSGGSGKEILTRSYGFTTGTGAFNWNYNAGNTIQFNTDVTIANNTLLLQGGGGQHGTITGAYNGTFSGTVTQNINASTIHVNFTDPTKALTFAGNVYLSSSSSAITLTLDAQSGNVVVSGAIRDWSGGTFSGGGGLAIGQGSSTGTVTLSGNNAYTGTTTVNTGFLRVTGTLSAGTVSVSGGCLGGIGAIGGTVTVSSTGGIDLRDGAMGTLTLGSNLNITGVAAANKLYFDLGTGANGTDKIMVAGNTTISTSGAAVITMNQLSGAKINEGTYDLIDGAGTMASAGRFALSPSVAWGNRFALQLDTLTSKKLQLVVTDSTGPIAAYWKGGTTNWSTVANWNTDVASGVTASAAPGFQSNVGFYTTTPAAGSLTTGVLDADFDINSLNFLSTATSPVTIGGTRTLSIEAAAVNGNTAGNGITDDASGVTHTISANIGLRSSQTWTVNSGASLTVSGLIAEFGGSYSLTKAGTGTLTSSGNNIYTGPTIVDGGALKLTGTFAGTGSMSINSTGLLLLAKASGFAVSGLAINVNNGGVLQFGSNDNFGNASGGATLANAPTVTINAGGTLNNGGAFINSIYKLTLNGGTVYATGGSSANSWGAYNIGGTVTVSGSSASTISSDGGTLAFINLSATGTTFNVGDVTAGTDLIVSSPIGAGGDQPARWGGTLSYLIKTGPGTMLLSGLNTYTGGTTIKAGTVSVSAGLGNGAAGNLGSATSTTGTLTLGGGILQVAGDAQTIARPWQLTEATSSGIDVTGANTLTITTAAPGTTGVLTKSGTGVLVLTGTNAYTGVTTVNAGTLKINSASATGYSGGVTVAAGTLGGSGTISGPVSVNSAGHLAPGNSIGTLNAGSLTLASGSYLDFEFGSTLNDNDKIMISGGAGAFAINGTSTLNLCAPGGGTWTPTVAGTYDLIQFGGAIQGGGTMTVGGTISGFSYSLSTNATAGWLSVIVTDLSSSSEWTRTTAGSGDWSDAGNWSGGVPGIGGIVDFGTGTATGTINLDTNGTLSRMNFRTVDTTISGSGSITMERAGTAIIYVTTGNTHTISSSVSLNSNTAITTSGTGAMAIGGTISGASGIGLTKDGTGTLTLSGNNSYTGGTTLSAGILSLANANALGSGGSITFSGGSLQLAGTYATDYGNRIQGSGGAIAIDVTSGNTATFTSVIDSSNAGGLTKTGNGVLTLANSSSYAGGTTISLGTLQIGAGGTTGSLSTTSAIVDNATLAFNRTDTVTQGTDFNSVISGSGQVVQAGSGTLVLNGANTFSGGVSINAGTVSANTIDDVSSAIGAGSGTTGTLTFGGVGGVLKYTGTGGTTARQVVLNSTGTIAGGTGTLTLAGTITGNGGLVKVDTGKLTLPAVNTFSGGVTINGGTLSIGTLADAAGGLGAGSGSTGTLTFGGGRLVFTGATDATSRQVYLSSNGIVDTGTSGDVTLSGAIAGGGGLAKLGAGTLTLSGANSYSGATTLNAGRFNIGSVNALGTTATLTLSGGTIDNITGGLVTLSSNPVVNLGGTVAFFDPTANHSLTLGTGTVTIGGNATITVNGSGNLGVSTISSAGYIFRKSGAGTLTINSGSLNQSDSGQQPFYLDQGQLTFTTTINAHYWTLHLANGTTLDAASNVTYTTQQQSIVAGAIYIDGSFTFLGTGGDLTLNPGQNAGNGFAVASTSTITVSNNTLTLGRFPIVESGGSRGLTKAGAGTLTINVANSITGGMTINGGVLKVGAVTALGVATGTLTFTGPSILNLGSFSPTIGALASDGSYGTISALSGSPILTVNQAANTTFGGVIENGGATSVSLAKSGTGTLILTGASTYTGGTTVDAGMLWANNTTGSATGTNVVTVASGAELGGTGAIAGAVVIADGGTLSPGMNGAGVLVLNNALTLAANATFAVSVSTNAALASQSIVSNGAPIYIAGARLRVSLAPGYVPKDGDVFTLISNVSGGSSALSGPFAILDIENSTIPGDITAVGYTVTYPDGNVVLTYRYEAPGTIVIVK